MADLHAKIQLILVAHEMLQETMTSKPGNKMSHNKLERGRRAHLRKCMDELKSRLNRIPPGTRLTTLVILRSAMDQIHSSRARQVHLQRVLLRMQKDHQVAVERHRRLTIEVEKMKSQLRRDRCSGSECSITTTLSDESSCGMDSHVQQPPQHSPPVPLSSTDSTTSMPSSHSLALFTEEPTRSLYHPHVSSTVTSSAANGGKFGRYMLVKRIPPASKEVHQFCEFPATSSAAIPLL